jgi:hypothetical protein
MVYDDNNSIYYFKSQAKILLGGQKLKKKVRSVGKGVLIIGIILDPIFECHLFLH